MICKVCQRLMWYMDTCTHTSKLHIDTHLSEEEIDWQGKWALSLLNSMTDRTK